MQRFSTLAPLVLLLGSSLEAAPDRLTTRIDNRNTIVLSGHVHAQARAEYDRGAVEPSFQLPAITLHLKPGAAQGALDRLLAEQQDPSSANFHRWLTPAEYADRFGISQNDVDKIVAWLQSQGLPVQEVAASRTWITFSGTVKQVQDAFHTQIHQYQVGTATHYANATNPAIPAALAGMVNSLRGLSNFHLKPRLVKQHLSPEMTSASGLHHMAPDDLATIYDIAPLYQAGIDGSGQKLVVVGQTGIHTSDIQKFRTKFGLPAIDLQQVPVPNRPDPGISLGDMGEADLDIEWSSAVARKATIIYVYSDDVMASATYAIDHNLGSVLTMSYGSCEAANLGELPTTQALAQQANAQGMTWLAASGDAGAADCEDPSASVAQNGLAIDSPGSTPEITSMGGSEFADQGGSYWNASNTPNSASAIQYIPETAWNDTLLDGTLSAGGGGASVFFAQPVWQTGNGVPADGFRHVPDLSLSASADHVGYYVYTDGSASYYGGTSVAAPTMAGIVALLNQYLVSTGAQKSPGVGNINPALYRLAQNTTGVFHDITTGDNSVPCAASTPGCSGSSYGHQAGSGFDDATGLGSPDAYNLIHQWSSQAPRNSAVVPSIDQNPVFQQTVPDASGNKWTFILTLTEEAGIPTTLTAFTIDGNTYDPAAVFGATAIPANGSLSSKNLGLAAVAVPKSVAFEFSGVDASGRQWTEQFTVPFNAAQVPLTIGGAGNAASGQQTYAPGMLLSVYGTQMGTAAQSAATIPLPNYMAGFEASVNGVPAPLYYVSPGQVNIQIPYETQTGSATLTIGNPYTNIDYTIQIAAAAPGVFASNGFITPPFSSARRGQASTLFITGEGAVRPSVATGDTPSPGRVPKPSLPVTVTVGGQAADVSFSGIPNGLVGVTQINFTVPGAAPLGTQPVVVTVGTVASPPVNLTVLQ